MIVGRAVAFLSHLRAMTQMHASDLIHIVGGDQSRATEMIAELQVGHNNVGGGDVYNNAAASPGLLGADLAVVNGRYRIEKVFDGVAWNPFIDAPLTAPRVNARAGEYIMAVNGQPL